MPSVYVPPHIDGSMEADRFTTLLEGGGGGVRRQGRIRGAAPLVLVLWGVATNSTPSAVHSLTRRRTADVLPSLDGGL